MSAGSSGAASPPGGPSITELELRFAEQPDSDAFIPLCEAYLSRGRTMEAMVVCKKGVKARPDLLEGQLLMVRILSAQKKLSRAKKEIDRIVAENETRSEPYFARAQLAFEMGEVDHAMADLRATLERNPRHPGATAMWAQQTGAATPDEEATLRSTPGGGFEAPAPASTGAGLGPSTARSEPSRHAAPPGPPASYGAPSVGPAPGAPSTRASAGPVAPPPVARAFPPAAEGPRRRLEGEDELEALANRIADERPRGGRPWVTIALGVILLVAGGAFIAWRVIEKGRVEAVDELLSVADDALEEDKYRSYQRAAVALREVIEDYDADNRAAHGRLAQTYAILWGEHGELDLQPQLSAAIGAAEQHASDDGHTVAAKGLQRLYSGPDRASGARAALEVLEPHVSQRRANSQPPDASFITLGIALMASGDYQAAFRVLEEARSYLPSSVRAKVWLARAARRQGNSLEAKAAFQEALRQEPSHPGALIGLVQVQLERGNLAQAAQDLVKFDELRARAPKDISPKDQALAWYVRSELARSAGEETDADAAYRMALQLDPANPDFPFGLGRWLLEAERPKEALPHLAKAAEMEPERFGILVELAEAEMALQDYDAAEEHITRALERNPSFVPALLARARLMRRTEAPGLEDYLTKLLEEHPSARVDVKLELGRYHQDRGALDAAQKVFEEIVEQMGASPKPKQADVFLAYGRLMEERGQVGIAENAYEKAGELGKLEGWYRLAVIAKRAGHPKEAVKGCQRYLQAGTNLRYSETARSLCGI